MPVLCVEPNQLVRARAVAGSEAVPAGAMVATLDPTAAPGLTVAAGACLIVNGRIIVNSAASPAATADGGSLVEAAVYQIAGGTISGSFSPTRAQVVPSRSTSPPCPTP